MLTNYFKLALRNLLKNKLYTGINLVGLSIGIAATILIYRIITYELSYNKHFKNYDRIVRVIVDGKNKITGNHYQNQGMTLPAMDVIKRSVPQFKTTTKIKEFWPTIAVPNPSGGAPLKKFNTEEPSVAFFVEPAFFEIFDYQWLAGNAQSALNEVNTIVLTKSLAEKCFGDATQAIGQTIIMDNLEPYLRVEGVVNDPTPTSDFPITAFVSYPTFRAHPEFYFYSDDWGSTSTNNQFFALLNDPTQADATNQVLAGIGQEHYETDRGSRKHMLQPLSDLHYNEDLGTSGSHVMDKKKLWILGMIGFLILIMACFNFINMANAQSVTRIKEVGIRKTLGVSNGALMSGFLLETGLLVLCGILLGAGIAFVTTPVLQHISPLPADISLFSDFGLILFLLGLFVVVTLLAGLYPASVLTSFQPVKIFRSDYDKGFGSGVMLRKVLVVIQFVIAFGLIISTVVTLSQLSFIQNMNLGFNKDLVYTFGYNNDSLTQSRLGTLKNRVTAIPGVENMSVSSDMPSSGNTWSSNWSLSQGKEDAPFSISIKYCDEDFQKTYDIKLLSGRWLNQSDTAREAVLNRTALLKYGITNVDSMIGSPIRLGGGQPMILVGVAEDYHSHSAHEPLEALLMTSYNKFYFLASVKLKDANIHATTAAIANIYNDMFPEQVFKGTFYDTEIQRFYETDTKFTALCKGFALLAVLISCLGLFALASFAISRRLKEIGVRKVLGATTGNIVGLISKDFLILVMVAFFIAAPLSWYFMNQWLQGFVYRTDISWWMFVVAMVLVLTLAMVTVSTQAVKASWTNPVKSLRSE